MALCISRKKIKDICRLCLKQGETMSLLFDDVNREKKYNPLVDQINSIAHVEINNDDSLPLSICQKCKMLVKQFYEFRIQVENSDKALKSWIRAQSSSQNIENLSDFNSHGKEIIHTLSIPNDEYIQVWDVSNILQNSDELNKILKNEYMNNQENIQNSEEITVKENDINCELCFIPFTSLSDLKKHVIEHCSTSEKQIFGNESIHNSILIDENTKDNQRVIHIDETNKESKLVEKKDDVNKKLNITGKCTYCDNSFSKLALVIHSEKCRFRDKEFTCDECGKEFKKRSELRYHKGTHTTIPLTCEYCGKQFRNAQSFSIHIKRHTHGTRYRCETCGKSYYTNSELARHVQKHLDKRKHPCHLCDMSFMSQPELNRHLQYHAGVKRFECNICFKSYYESGHLKVHQRIHTGERPFVCQFCNKGFVTRSKLVRHAKIHEK